MARQAWNLAVEQRPVTVVLPESADDIIATVAFAAEAGLRIAFNGGGHNAGPIGWGEDVLLLKAERMQAIEIDARARQARVEAGVLAGPLAVVAGTSERLRRSSSSSIPCRRSVSLRVPGAETC